MAYCNSHFRRCIAWLSTHTLSSAEVVHSTSTTALSGKSPLGSALEHPRTSAFTAAPSDSSEKLSSTGGWLLFLYFGCSRSHTCVEAAVACVLLLPGLLLPADDPLWVENREPPVFSLPRSAGWAAPLSIYTNTPSHAATTTVIVDIR